MAKKIEIKDFLKGKLLYEQAGQSVFAVGKDGGMQIVCDVRGWGAIQNLFKDGSGKIDMEAAGKFQDELGVFIQDALNAKLNADEPEEVAERILDNWEGRRMVESNFGEADELLDELRDLIKKEL